MIPKSNSPAAAEAIEAVSAERNHPTNPAACARLGWEAAYREMGKAHPDAWRYRIVGAPEDARWEYTDSPEIAWRIADCICEDDGGPAYVIHSMYMRPA